MHSHYGRCANRNGYPITTVLQFQIDIYERSVLESSYQLLLLWTVVV